MTITLDEARKRWKPIYREDSAVARDMAQELRVLVRRRFDAKVPLRAMPSLEAHLRAWLRNESMAGALDEDTAIFLDVLLDAEMASAPSIEEALQEVAS